MNPVDLILVPTYFGCDNKGVEKSPQLLHNYIINSTHKDKINNVYHIDVPTVSDDYNKFEHPGVKYFKEIRSMALNVKRHVENSLINGNFPLIIGGDHSVSIGSLAGSISTTPNIDVIWIDAHADLNTITSSPSKNAHGMVLSNPLMLDNAPYKDIFTRKILPTRINYLGTRDLDLFEDIFIKQSEILQISTKELIKKNNDFESLNFIKKNVHLSIDIDVLDPDLSPGTGVKVENGIDLTLLMSMIDYVFKHNNVVCVDFVEFNPDLDVDNKSRNISFKILDKIITYV